MSIKDEIFKKIESRNLVCLVCGLGYVGLPLAIEFAKAGYKTIGLDVSNKKIDLLSKGFNYINNVNDDDISKLICNNKLFFTNDFSIVGDASFIAICVPTPLDRHQQPDISFVQDSASSISKFLKKNTMVVLESTTYPGTTEELLKPILESGSGLKCEKDFYLGFSPERVDPGNKIFKTNNTPKIVGAIGNDAAECISEVYKKIINADIHIVSKPSIAEMEKILENTYRNVNIALVNEFTRLCHRMNISIWEVIDAAKTKPYGFQAFYPGPGLGGHCIPLDPYYLSWKAREYGFHTTLIENSMTINDEQPLYCVERVIHMLNKHNKSINGAKILCIGVAYKKDVNDYRESPAVRIINELIKYSASVDYYDQWVPCFVNRDIEYKSISLLNREVISSYDLIVIVTDHSDIDYQLVIDNAKLVFDTRNITKKYLSRKNIEVL